MSADKPKPPKRRVIVRVTARDKNDPAALLNAVKNALSGHGVSIEVRTVGSDPLPVDAPPSSEIVKDEQLETSARQTVQSILAAAAAKADNETAGSERDASRKREEIVAQRRGLRAYSAFWFGQGVRITVEIYARIADAVAGIVSGALGGGGKGKKGD